MPLTNVHIETLAEDAWLLRFGNDIDVEINARVHGAAAQIGAALSDIECVPSYASLLLRFDPRHWTDTQGRFAGHHLRDAIDSALRGAAVSETPMKEVVIPVWYGAGEDLGDVAAHAGLSAVEVIARHTAVTYRVAMIGFAPGFPYLLGLDPTLAMPRRPTPRASVPAGSVAIGGQQTGVYPQALPGGWQLIGRTPVQLFDVSAEPPSLLKPGDRVRFRAIDEAQFDRIATQAGTAA